MSTDVGCQQQLHITIAINFVASEWPSREYTPDMYRPTVALSWSLVIPNHQGGLEYHGAKQVLAHQQPPTDASSPTDAPPRGLGHGQCSPCGSRQMMLNRNLWSVGDTLQWHKMSVIMCHFIGKLPLRKAVPCRDVHMISLIPVQMVVFRKLHFQWRFPEHIPYK